MEVILKKRNSSKQFGHRAFNQKLMNSKILIMTTGIVFTSIAIFFVFFMKPNVLPPVAFPPQNSLMPSLDANIQPSITKDQAHKIAETAIATISREHHFVILEDKTLEKRFGWVFFYTTAEYVKTGNIKDVIPGNGPLVVKKTGSSEFLSSSFPPEKAIEMYEKHWMPACLEKITRTEKSSIIWYPNINEFLFQGKTVYVLTYMWDERNNKGSLVLDENCNRLGTYLIGDTGSYQINGGDFRKAILTRKVQEIWEAYPECLKERIKKEEELWSKNDSHFIEQVESIDQFLFQGKTVYVLNSVADDAFLPVLDTNCEKLGDLGGFIGNHQISGVDFKEAIFVRKVWDYQIGNNENIPFIKKAIEVFQQKNPNVDSAQYKIEVIKKGESVTVDFLPKDRPAGSLGGPGFEVEMNEKDLTVLRSNFIR